MKKIGWIIISLLGAFAFALIALQREESINAIWFITAAVCIYMVAYRFYAAWIATKVFVLDEFRKTPAVRLSNNRDFVPTNKWVLFGIHFAAIAGPGPPTTAPTKIQIVPGR